MFSFQYFPLFFRPQNINMMHFAPFHFPHPPTLQHVILCIDQQAEWTQKSLSRIKKRRKQFMAGKLTNWTETAPMTGAAHLAVVQDALKNCAADAANVDPVDAMLDTFMSTVPSLLNVLAEDGVESSKLGRLMAQPLLLPGITNFCGTLPFLDPKSD